MIRKILVPLDRSNFAEQALTEAKVLAQQVQASIRLLLVHQPVPYAGFEDVPWYHDEATAEAEYLSTMLKELTDTGIVASSSILRGNPANVIWQEAARSECDLIVMTSHGRTGLNRMWLGSVADGVIRHSTIPVLLIRPVGPEVPHSKSVADVRHILVTLDGSALARAVLPAATDLARCTGARVTLLTVVQPVPWIPPVTNMPFAFAPAVYDETVTRELVSAAEKDLAAEKANLQKLIPSVETSIVVAPSVAHAIMECIDSRNVDLVAMSTHGRGASRFLLGSTADKIVRASDKPVLLFHPQTEVVDDKLEEERAAALAMP